MEEPKPPARRGFASMTPERRKEVARLGGFGVPNDKRHFAVNKASAVEAGRKGGRANKKPPE
jgi:general stress protein YciG